MVSSGSFVPQSRTQVNRGLADVLCKGVHGVRDIFLRCGANVCGDIHPIAITAFAVQFVIACICLRVSLFVHPTN